MSRPLRLVWIDLEMTGLDPERDCVLEIGCIVTGADLAPLDEVDHVVWQPDDALSRMRPVVREMHTQNGLLDRVRQSTMGLDEVERAVFATIAKHCGPREGILAGSSIHMDRMFLARYMPLVERYLHYRQVDVSSLKVLTQAWYPSEPSFQKPGADHTALADIRESLRELKHYRERFFKA
jgi:oligoribonuclease